MENVYNALEEVITTIKNTKEYQNCLSMKEKMNTNEEIRNLIEEIKKVQKKYIQSNYDVSIKEQLDTLEKQLNEIPIYVSYIENLTKVNEMIEYVKDSLNEYMNDLVNQKY